MAAQDAKKRFERKVVGSLLYWMGSRVRPKPHEEPDFVARFGKQLVGIELTELIDAKSQSTAPQRWAAEAWRVVGATQREFETRRPEPLIVYLEMNPTWDPPRKAGIAPLAAELSKVVEDVLDNPSPWHRPEHATTKNDPHTTVSRIYVDRVRHGGAGLWRPQFVADVYAAPEADVQATIGSKETKLDRYRQAAPVTWLVIHTGRNAQGRSLDTPSSLRVTSRFDRVFCGVPGISWAELAVARPANPRC